MRGIHEACLHARQLLLLPPFLPLPLGPKRRKRLCEVKDFHILGLGQLLALPPAPAAAIVGTTQLETQ